MSALKELADFYGSSGEEDGAEGQPQDSGDFDAAELKAKMGLIPIDAQIHDNDSVDEIECSQPPQPEPRRLGADHFGLES